MGSSDTHRNRGGAVKSAAQVLVDDAAGAGVREPGLVYAMREFGIRNSGGACYETEQGNHPQERLEQVGEALPALSLRTQGEDGRFAQGYGGASFFGSI